MGIKRKKVEERKEHAKILSVPYPIYEIIYNKGCRDSLDRRALKAAKHIMNAFPGVNELMTESRLRELIEEVW